MKITNYSNISNILFTNPKIGDLFFFKMDIGIQAFMVCLGGNLFYHSYWNDKITCCSIATSFSHYSPLSSE